MQATPVTAPPSARPRVLIVEDSGPVGAMMRLALEGPYEVELRTSIRAAAERLAQSPAPSLILADMHLPDGTALALLALARRMPGSLPVVLMSGRPESLAQAPGADACLPKPVQAGVLRETVGRLLGRAPSKALPMAQ